MALPKKARTLGRENRQEKGYSQLKKIPEYDGLQFDPLVGFLDRETDTFTPANQSARYSAWTPMASVAYRMPEQYFDDTEIDSFMTYFTYSRGFKSGGFEPRARASRVEPGNADGSEEPTLRVRFQMKNEA